MVKSYFKIHELRRCYKCAIIERKVHTDVACNNAIHSSLLLFTSQYILLDGALIYETSLLSFFYIPEDGHIRCRNNYEVIIHKKYFTSVNFVRIVTLYTLNARLWLM